MRPTLIAIALTCGLVALTGCSGKSHLALNGDDGKSSVTVDNGKVVAESTDDKGKKSSVDIEGSAHIALHDGDGNGLNFDADKGGFSLKAKGDDGQTSIETGKTITESDLGLPYYPGSTEIQSSSLRFESSDKKGVVSSRLSDDDPAKVIEFYRSRIKVESVNTTSGIDGEKCELKGKDDAGDEIGIGANRDKGESKTTVTVAVVATKPK